MGQVRTALAFSLLLKIIRQDLCERRAAMVKVIASDDRWITQRIDSVNVQNPEDIPGASAKNRRADDPFDVVCHFCDLSIDVPRLQLARGYLWRGKGTPSVSVPRSLGMVHAAPATPDPIGSRRLASFHVSMFHR